MLSSPSALFLPVLIPLVFGIFILVIRREHRWVKETLAILGMTVTFIVSLRLFLSGTNQCEVFSLVSWEGIEIGFSLIAYHFNCFILLATTFFGILVSVYSVRKMEGDPRSRQYYAYLLLTVAAAAGSILSDNLVVFLLFWGVLAVLLYLLICLGARGSERAGMKALLMVGGSDVIMLLGAGIIFYLTGTFRMSELSLPLEGWLTYVAFFCLLIGALTKAGAMPFHSWIPDSAETAPVPVMAFLPGSIDKLLGIYLLTRICLDFFQVIPLSAVSIILMVIGSVTIIAAVGMAVVQKHLVKLLAFHAVSQVGYMVLGIGTGLPIGIIGGLFHMINNCVYKTSLFLCAGAVEHRTNTVQLERLGGLASVMPVTFFSSLVAALAISGIPPLNGFFSKWMIYQGVIELGQSEGSVWLFPIFLTVAAFGSVLTFASFVKTLHSAFLGGHSRAMFKTTEVKASMWMPLVILSVFAISMGLFASTVVRYFLTPIVGDRPMTISGAWTPGLAAIFILAGLGVGALVYLMTGTRRARVSPSFVGGEVTKYEAGTMVSIHLYPKSTEEEELIGGSFDYEGLKIPASHFYDSIRTIALLREVYKVAGDRFFDLYEQISKPFSVAIRILRRVHNGALPDYIGLCFLGGSVIIFVLLLLHFRLV